VGAATTAVVDSTIEVYNQIREQLLPTPSKPHYTFNLRDVARVIQGVMRADPKTTTEPCHLTLLWLHEAHRVFADRLINADDTQWFRYSVHACDPVVTCCYISCWVMYAAVSAASAYKIYPCAHCKASSCSMVSRHCQI